MLALGLVLSVFGIGFVCWLLFALAIYALPFLAGMTAGLVAYHSGAGMPGTLIVGVLAGALTLVAGQLAFALVASPILRGLIALVFVVPAAVAGYHTTLGLAHIGVPSAVWREVFAVIGAVVIGGTALMRMAALAVPADAGRIAGGTGRDTEGAAFGRDQMRL